MEKYVLLLEKLREKKKLAIAFSGGVDSALVAYAAKQTGIDVILITLTSPLFSMYDEKIAKQIAQEFDFFHIVVPHSLDKHVMKNEVMRCYYCKYDEGRVWKDVAQKHGFSIVADGANYDDVQDIRRLGIKACNELGIWHPLAETKISKKEVRNIAKKIGLPIWNRPSNACLASRIAYGEEITIKKLEMIEEAETLLRRISPQVRVRLHRNIARIEVPIDVFKNIILKRGKIVEQLRKIGFVYVSLDLDGYRTGSMHEENAS